MITTNIFCFVFFIKHTPKNMGCVLNFCHYFLLLPHKNMGYINKKNRNYGKNQIQRLTGSGNTTTDGKESPRESGRSIRV